MKNSKYTTSLLVLFAVFILSAAVWTLFIYKPDYLKIYVVYYKPAPLIKSDIFVPIQAGRKIADTPSRQGVFTKEQIDWLNTHMIGDDTGDNISELNRSFAEITALYWIAQNTTSPFIGMFQYRRVLSLNANTHYPMVEFPSTRFHHLGIKHLETFSKQFLRDLELEKKFILPWFATHDILLSEPIKLNTYQQYQTEHNIKDLDRALEILKQKYPEMYDFAIENLNSEEGFYPSHLFITRREILTAYTDWLFSILLPLYAEIKDEINARDTEQKLAFAYLSERLFTIYFRYQAKYHGLRIKEFPFALASDFFTPPAGVPFLNLKTPDWQDLFLDQKDGRLCSFNNTYRNCGKYEFLPQNRLKIKWDNGGTSYFYHTQGNKFELEK